MNKLLLKLPAKKVEMSDLVSPKPSKKAEKVVKVALHKSYSDQQAIRQKATAIRSK